MWRTDERQAQTSRRCTVSGRMSLKRSEITVTWGESESKRLRVNWQFALLIDPMLQSKKPRFDFFFSDMPAFCSLEMLYYPPFSSVGIVALKEIKDPCGWRNYHLHIWRPLCSRWWDILQAPHSSPESTNRLFPLKRYTSDRQKTEKICSFLQGEENISLFFFHSYINKGHSRRTF